MKFARVNLEPESFGDPRFAHLARLLGMPGGDGHFALIKVALIWSWQTEHYTPDAPCFHVPEDVVEMALGVDGAAARAALVRSRLAEETPDGLRMRGSSHDRTGWLWRIRNKSQAGGHAKAESAKRKKANESLPGAEHGHASGVPGETPLSSLLSVPEDLSHPAGAREPEPPPTTQPVASDRWRKLALALHDRWADAGRALTTELGLTAKVGGAMPSPATVDRILAAVAIWAGEAMATDRDLEAVAGERMDHLLAVRTAAARVERDVRWWAAPQFWGADSIERDLARDPKRAAVPRDGPRRQSPHAPAPPRKFQTLGPNPHTKSPP